MDIFPGDCRGSSALPHAVGGDCGAVRAGGRSSVLGGSFRQFFSLAIFAEWMFYMIAGSTVFVFRRREPRAERPYRVWGYPVVPALFVLASTALLYYTFTDNLKSSAGGCLAILVGVPVFYFFARRRSATPK